MLKTHKNATKILAVFINTMIKGANIFAVEKAQHFLFELSAALAGDNFHEGDLLLNRFLNNAVQFSFDLVTAIVDVVQIKF